MFHRENPTMNSRSLFMRLQNPADARNHSLRWLASRNNLHHLQRSTAGIRLNCANPSSAIPACGSKEAWPRLLFILPAPIRDGDPSVMSGSIFVLAHAASVSNLDPKITPSDWVTEVI